MGTSSGSFDVLLIVLGLFIPVVLILRGIQMLVWPQALWDRFSRPFFGSMMSPDDKSVRLVWRVSGAVMILGGVAFLVVLVATLVAAVPAPQSVDFQRQAAPAALPITALALFLLGLALALWPKGVWHLTSSGLFISDQRGGHNKAWIVRLVGVGFLILAGRTLYLWMSGK